MAWYSVRCVFRHDPDGPYEERITIWNADGFDDAIKQAELDAAEYADDLQCRYLGLAQAYAMANEPLAGAEVFSLMRDSELTPAVYLNTFFDTSAERQL
jgi:hypothetical protein